jgi:hypothetical protein
MRRIKQSFRLTASNRPANAAPIQLFRLQTPNYPSITAPIGFFRIAPKWLQEPPIRAALCRYIAKSAYHAGNYTPKHALTRQ